MKILDRYIFSNFISIFLFCLVLLFVLFVVGDIFGFLDEILREKISAQSLLAFYIYMSPYLITQIAPISCLLASVFLLGNLNLYNEVTAIKASGVGLISVLRPMLLGSIIIGAGLFILNDRVVPDWIRVANKIRYEKLEVGKRGAAVTLKNVAIYGQGNKIVYAKSFDVAKNTMHDIIIHEQNSEQRTISKINVQQMTWIDSYWWGKEIFTYYIDDKGEIIATPDYKQEGRVELAESPLEFINNRQEPQFMKYSELKKYLTVFLAGSKAARMRFTVDLHYKISFPFSCLAMILIAAPFTLVKKRGGALLGVAKGILIGLSYVPLVAIGLALGKAGVIPPALSAWFANIILCSVGLYFTLKN